MSKQHGLKGPWRGAIVAGVTGSLAIGTIVLSTDAVANFGAITATTAVNVRSQPSLGGKVLGVLYRGEKLTQIGKVKSGWVPVKFGTKTAYISANYITGAKATQSSPATRASDKGAAYTTEALNVRSGPSIRFTRLGLLPRGSKVELTGLASGGFRQVTYRGERAWVSGAYLAEAKPGSTSTTTATGKVRATAQLAVRNSSGRPMIARPDIPKGTVLPITGNKAGNVTEVIWRGDRVWVSSPYVADIGATPTPSAQDLPAEIGTRYATVALNVRTSPSTSSNVVGVLPQGAGVRVTGTIRSGFAQVNYNGAARWVSAQYLAKSPNSSGGNTGGGGGGGTGGDEPSGPINLNGSIGLSGLEPKTRHIVNVVAGRWGLTTFYGVRPDALPDHPSGHAVDIMIPRWSTSAGNAQGWAIAEYLRANANSLGVQYVIFDQKIWNRARDREGWRRMGDRGGATANHRDHVHVTTTGL